MELTFRDADSGDLDSIVDIFRDCWLNSYKELLPEDVRNEMTLEKARELWAPPVTPSDKSRATLVCEIEGKVVGFARIGSDPVKTELGHLFSLYVGSQVAGRGIGQMILNTALLRLTTMGFKEISLWVFKDNLIAQNLYRKNGFLPTGLERTDARWKISEIEMLSTTQT